MTENPEFQEPPDCNPDPEPDNQCNLNDDPRIEDDMKHTGQYYANQIMENISDATPLMQKKVCKLTNGTPLHDLSRDTLWFVFNMIMKCEVR